MKKIVIAHGHSSLEIFHSLFPFLLDYGTSNFCYQYVDYHLNDIRTCSGDILIIVRKYQIYNLQQDDCIAELNFLRKRFARIVYFDDSAAVSYIMFNIIDYVDQYWVRGLLTDLSVYHSPLYGGRTYTDYYHQHYSVVDHFPTISPTCVSFPHHKIKVAWNIGAGSFPFSSSHFLSVYHSYIKKFSCLLAIASAIPLVSKIVRYYYYSMISVLNKPLQFMPQKFSVNARFTYKAYSSTVGYQRRSLLTSISSLSNFHTNRLPSSLYLSGLDNDFAVLSPFGWGEVCYRDFESVLFGKLLIKPSMSHIQTWPNIYTDNTCYLFDWDCTDFKLLNNPDYLCSSKNFERISHSRSVYLSSLLLIKQRLYDLLNSL